jgi:hypothetical protein
MSRIDLGRGVPEPPPGFADGAPVSRAIGGGSLGSREYFIDEPGERVK